LISGEERLRLVSEDEHLVLEDEHLVLEDEHLVLEDEHLVLEVKHLVSEDRFLVSKNVANEAYDINFAYEKGITLHYLYMILILT
jgi:hypothetical protein